MASAILARRNEPHWPEAKVYMRKPHPSPRSKISNPNPNPNFGGGGGCGSPDRCDELAASSRVAVSDDSSKAASVPDAGYRYVAFNIASYTLAELRELKRRLVSELDQVRGIVGRIESREIQSSLGHSVSGMYGGGGREVTSYHEGFAERPAKKKKKTAFGGCRPVASSSSLGAANRSAAAPVSERALADMMIKCRQILTKLLKQKGSNWFKTPVDVEGMKLFDYYQTIKHPMDLGTVRTNLSKGLYSTPTEFADDVRLTFNNALVYNPKGHVVNEVAGRMLRYFDGEFGSAYARYENQQAAIAREQQDAFAREEDARRRSASWSQSPMIDRYHASVIERSYAPVVERSHPPMFEAAKWRADPVLEISPPRPAPVPQPEPVSVPDPALAQQDELEQQQQQQRMNVNEMVIPRKPKPKAKDLNKRPMSIEEKGRLGDALQNLPQEKMEQVLQIVKKRHGALSQEGDEVELDFEVLDAETLWELDRFVTNFKKSMSKFRRHEAMATGIISAAPPQSLSVPVEEAGYQPPMSEVKRIKGEPAADDDVVDIGDDLPTGNYPSVEIDKDNAVASSSGSDSSSSSGSSGSDSDSSSGSDSNADDGRSPAAGRQSSV